MELKFKSDSKYVNKSDKKKPKIRKKDIVINKVSHQLELREYGEKVGFDIVISSTRTNYYLQIDSKKSFDGFSGSKKRGSYFSSSYLEDKDKMFDVSQNSLLKLFQDTFFSQKKYCSFEFLFNEREDENRNGYFGRRVKIYRSANTSKRRKVSELDILYLRIKIRPNTLSHLVKEFSYFFTFLSMPNIKAFDLPDEMLLEIFQFLETDFLLVKMNCVCKRFNKLVESEFMCKMYYQRMFPEDNVTTKPNPQLSWKENMEEKFRTSIQWKFLDFDDDFTDETSKKNAVGRIKGSPTNATLHNIGDFTFFTTNCFVSAMDSHEWVVKLKNERFRGLEFARIGIIPKDEGGGEFLGHEGGYGLSLGNGTIEHHGNKEAYTYSGGYEPSYGRYGLFNDDDDGSEFEDFGLFGGDEKKGGKTIKMVLSKGTLSFVFGEKKHEVSCSIDKKERKKTFSLCFNPYEDTLAEIVSFRKFDPEEEEKKRKEKTKKEKKKKIKRKGGRRRKKT